MRIISGKYGGRKLCAFSASHIRPTTDRIKEVIFNKLQGSIEGSQVLDLFSGTGNLAIESLSRGASQVVAVELNHKSLQIIQKNKQLLGIQSELQIIKKDVLRFLKSDITQKFDIIIIDPPFTQKMADEVLNQLASSPCFHADTEIFIESTSQELIQDTYGVIELKKRQSYGDKFLSHYVISSHFEGI